MHLNLRQKKGINVEKTNAVIVVATLETVPRNVTHWGMRMVAAQTKR
jgi:hypothetical protein